MNSQKREVLLKFGSEENILSSFENEYLFFNNQGKFRQEDEDNTGINDPKEGNLDNIQIKELTIYPDSKTPIQFHEVFNGFNSQKTSWPNEISDLICSLYKLTLHGGMIKNKIDEKMINFKPSILVIYDIRAFMSFLSQSELKYGTMYGTMKYYDPKTYDGNLSRLHKDIKLSWQNEYRLIINNPNLKEMKLPVPNLKKMSHIFETSKFKEINSIIIEERPKPHLP